MDSETDEKTKKLKLFQRQESWMEFKGRAFKMASTVVLPRNRRVSTRSCAQGNLKTPNMSVKSLPQIRLDSVPMSRKFVRSISERHGDHDWSSQHPAPSKRKFEAKGFVPQKTLEEVEELESASCSPRASFGSSEDERSIYDNVNEDSLPLDLSCTVQSPEHAQMDNQSPSKKPWKMKRDLPPITTSLLTKVVLGSEEPKSNSHYTEMPILEKVPHSPLLEGEAEGGDSEDETAYHNFYNCVPPPVFMLCITFAEIGFFVYHSNRLLNDPKYGYISKYGPAPLDSRLIYDPTRRFEVWRYFTYALVHSGYLHLINNIVVQLVLGILLEMVHKWWRVLAIYFAGILAGSLATSISQPFNYLAGASAGVYALITAHLSTVILNWTEMEYPWVRILVFFAFVVHDAGTAIYYGYIVGEKINVGYAAHLGGAVAGLLVGIHVLKNLKWKKWEEVLWWVCVLICIALLLFAIAWNIFRSDLFP